MVSHNSRDILWPSQKKEKKKKIDFFFFFLRNPLDLLMGYLMHTTQISKTTLGLVMTFWMFFIQINKAKKNLVVII